MGGLYTRRVPVAGEVRDGTSSHMATKASEGKTSAAEREILRCIAKLNAKCPAEAGPGKRLLSKDTLHAGRLAPRWLLQLS